MPSGNTAMSINNIDLCAIPVVNQPINESSKLCSKTFCMELLYTKRPNMQQVKGRNFYSLTTLRLPAKPA
jgi:hypothetical protein